mgnify:CR=1 FL=1
MSDTPGRARLGRAYWRLWTASAISNTGDGVLIAALPLLAASVTTDRISIGLVSTAFTVPWLLFALPAGAVVDRSDRRRVLVITDVCRALLVGAVAVVAAVADVQIWMLWLLSLGLGIGEVFFDSTSQALVPSLVAPDHLERANGLRWSAEIAGNSFVGTSMGSILLGVAVWVPFGLDAATFAVAAALAVSLRGALRVAPAAETERPPSTWRADIREGMRWLWSHTLMRNLAIAIAISNLAFAACESTFVLFATERLGVSDDMFGPLIAVVAAGSIGAGLVAGSLVQRMGRRFTVLFVSLAPAVTMLAIGTLPITWWVIAMTTAQAALITIFSVVTVSLRQQAVPAHLFGRVNGVFRWFSWGAMPIGAFVGGVVADVFGLRAPYFAGAILMVAAWSLIVLTVTPRRIDEAIAAAA